MPKPKVIKFNLSPESKKEKLINDVVEHEIDHIENQEAKVKKTRKPRLLKVEKEPEPPIIIE